MAVMTACLMAAGNLVALPTRADDSDTFNARAFATVITDNNLFRLPDGFAPPPEIVGSSARSDTIHAKGIAATLDKSLSLQRFHLGANLADYRFRNFSFLDYRIKGFDAAWHWSLTPDLQGKIGRERTQSLNDFNDFRGFSSNVKTQESRNATLTYGVTGNWQLLGGINRSHVGNDILIEPTGEPTNRHAEAGIRYLDRDGDSLTLIRRRLRVDWANSLPDPVSQTDVHATQDDTELQLHWRLTGKSVLQATLARLNRHHENFASRDYSGKAANISVTWLPGDKLQVPLALSRSYQPWWELTSSYMAIDSLTLTPFWQPTPKTAVKLRLDRSKRDFLGALPTLPTAFAAAPRRDDTRSAQLTLNWVPLRSISVSAIVQKERRLSSLADREYRATLTAINVQLSF